MNQHINLVILDFDLSIPAERLDGIRAVAATVGEIDAAPVRPGRQFDRRQTARINWRAVTEEVRRIGDDVASRREAVLASGFAPLSVWFALGQRIGESCDILGFVTPNRDATGFEHIPLPKASHGGPGPTFDAARSDVPITDEANYDGPVSVGLDLLAHGLTSHAIRPAVTAREPILVASRPTRVDLQLPEQCAAALAECVANLRAAKARFPKAESIRLFPSMPAFLGLFLGARLPERVFPRFLVYEFHNQDTPQYTLATETVAAPTVTRRVTGARSLSGSFVVQPAEPVFFGPPKSFTAGEIRFARSEFPPSPWGWQGVVRTRLLHGATPPVDLSGRDTARIASLVGPPDALPDGWQLAPPLPVCRTKDDGIETWMPWLPAPAFLLRNARGRPSRLVPRLQPLEWSLPVGSPAPSNAGAGVALVPEHPDAESTYADWLSAVDYLEVLCGRDPRAQGASAGLPPFATYERVVGLQTDDQRGAAVPGMIYTNDWVRFAPRSGFLGRLTTGKGAIPGASALIEGAGGAGRRARTVHFAPAEGLAGAYLELAEGRHLPGDVDDGALFWVVAASPMVAGGSASDSPLPAFAPPGSGACTITAEPAGRLDAGRMRIGGMRIDGRARENVTCAAAGSAWLCRITGASSKARADALRALNGSYSGAPPFAAFGFGLVYCSTPLAIPTN